MFDDSQKVRLKLILLMSFGGSCPEWETFFFLFFFFKASDLKKKGAFRF